MSRSTDAFLAFGYHLGGDEGWEIKEADEYGAWEPDEDDGFAGDDLGEWIESRLPEGVQLVTHCSDAAPMYIIATEVYQAWRGKVVVVPDGSGYGYKAKDRRLLRDALKTLGMTPEQTAAKWLLVSYGDGFQ